MVNHNDVFGLSIFGLNKKTIMVNHNGYWLSVEQKMNISNVKVIPDGSGLFTKYMGMLISKDHDGFGQRSWRYMAIINDEIMQKGSKILGFTIAKISDSEVRLKRNRDRITLELIE